MEKKAIRGKQYARKLAVQALYQWLMTNQNLSDIEVQYRLVANQKVDLNYFSRLLHGVPKDLSAIETALAPVLDRKVEELNPVEHAVLWLGAFELMFCLEMPYKVVLDEAITLTKTFGSQDGYKYVNGVLNNLAKSLRKIEINFENE